MILINIILALSLQKIGAVKQTLMWAEIDTTNDSIMWYAIDYGNNDYGIFHDYNRIWYMKIGGTSVNGYPVSGIQYKIYNNDLIFVVFVEDSINDKERLYFLNGHGEIYKEEDFTDIISSMGTRTGYIYPSGEDWEDTTRLDTIINGHCIGIYDIHGIEDTDFAEVEFLYEGWNINEKDSDYFTVETYVDLINRRVYERYEYPYLFGSVSKEGDYFVAVRGDSVFVSRIYPEVQLLYTKYLTGSHLNFAEISRDGVYFQVGNFDSVYLFKLSTGELIREVIPDSMPQVHYTWKSKGISIDFCGKDYALLWGPVTKYAVSAMFLYRLEPYRLLTWAEYPGYDIGAASCDKEGRLYIGMRDTLRGDTVKIFVIDTLQNIVGQYQFPTNIPNDRDGVGTYLNGKYLYVEVPDFLADSTYIFKVEE